MPKILLVPFFPGHGVLQIRSSQQINSLFNVATVWEENNSRTSRGLSTHFSRPIPSTFCQVTKYLVMAILDSMQCFSNHIKTTNGIKFVHWILDFGIKCKILTCGNNEILKFKEFQGPFTSNSKTFKTLFCFQGVSRSWKYG